MSTIIHPTAIVSKHASIGENVKIGPYCVVDDKTVIGSGTEMRAFAKVCDYTEIGSDCTLHEHCVIGGLPQDLSFKGEETWVRVGSGVVFREFVTVNRAAGEGQETRVGDKCFIMEGVHLAHNVKVGREVTIANKSGLSGHVHVGDYAVIGGLTGFHQFVHVGPYCMVGGMSRVVQDVPPYCLAAGVPLRVYDINKIGLRRRGIDLASRTHIREIYRILYNSGLTFREALSKLTQNFADDAIAKLIVDFAAESKRGFSPRVTQDWHKPAVAEAEI